MGTKVKFQDAVDFYSYFQDFAKHFLGSGLLDPENVAYRTVKVKRSLTWPKLNSRISEYFGVPDGTFRIWIFKKKHDQDVWRPEPLEEEDTSEREIKDVSARFHWNLVLVRNLVVTTFTDPLFSSSKSTRLILPCGLKFLPWVAKFKTSTQKTIFLFSYVYTSRKRQAYATAAMLSCPLVYLSKNSFQVGFDNFCQKFKTLKSYEQTRQMAKRSQKRSHVGG